jgi:molybdate transport system substrate-binding protein
MYKKAIAFLIAGIVIGGLGAAALEELQTNASRTIVVFAGAAAAPVYSEAASMFESKYGVKVELRLGGSGTLLSAMKVAETGDVYIPGSPDYLLQANELGVVNLTVSQGKIMAYLVPAIIVQKGNPKNVTRLEDLAKPGIRVGIGDPASVCVGLYAEELLEVNGLWTAVSPNIMTYAQSCEATAALIPTHAVDAIIGWHVFHYWNPDKADIVWIEPSKIPKISYIAGAVTTFARDRDLAARFLDFLASTDMRETWAKYGYFPTVEEAKAHAPNAAIEMIE